MDKRQDFLRAFVDDVLHQRRKTWAQYGEQFGEHPERLRKWARTLRTSWGNKEWYPGNPMDTSDIPRVAEALEFEPATSPTAFPEKYDGVKPRRAWEQRTKDGEIVTLHSYEFNSELKDLQAFQDSIIEKVQTLIAAEEIKPVFLEKPELRQEWALNVYTTDKHAGSLVRNPLFGNAYDNDEFERRLQETLKAVQLCASFTGGLDLVNFVDLGDSIDGVGGKTTRGGHGLDQYLEDTDQFDLFVNSHKTLFAALHEIGGIAKVRFTAACNDNHGGFGSYVVARALEEYLRIKYPEMETDVQRAFMFHQEYGVHRFVYTHGKDDRYRNRPFPMKLDADTERFVGEYIDYHGLGKHLGYSQERACIHLIKGDLHSSAEEYSKRFRYKNVMSMFGSSSWIQHNFGAGYKGFEFELVSKATPTVFSCKNFYF